VPLHDVEEVFLRQGGDFFQDVAHGFRLDYVFCEVDKLLLLFLMLSYELAMRMIRAQ
jgi:hypothetical protein